MYKPFPEKFDRESICNVVKELQQIDKTQILNTHRIDELAVIIYLIRSTGRELKETELFEAGACPARINNSLYSGNINFFFSNYPELAKYKAFDSTHHYKYYLKPANITDSIHKIMNSVHKDRDDAAAKPIETINKTIDEQTICTYEEFSAEIMKAKDPIIFSTFVFGCPEINQDQRFWQLPGKHIHIGGIIDYISEWTKKFYPQTFEENDLMSSVYEHDPIFPKEFLEKTSYKKSKEQWKIIGEELFDIKNIQVGFITPLETVYYYEVK